MNWAEPTPERAQRQRKTFKQWLRNLLKDDDYRNDKIYPVASTQTFNNHYSGWTIKLHRANGGHIVECWKVEPDHSTTIHHTRPSHELFMVSDQEDMGARLNDILVQLMLRG